MIAGLPRGGGLVDRGDRGHGMLAGAEDYVRNTEEAVNAGCLRHALYIVDRAEKFWRSGPDRGPGPVLARHALTGFARTLGQGARTRPCCSHLLAGSFRARGTGSRRRCPIACK